MSSTEDQVFTFAIGEDTSSNTETGQLEHRLTDREVSLFDAPSAKGLCDHWCTQPGLSLHSSSISLQIADGVDQSVLLEDRSPLPIVASSVYIASQGMGLPRTFGEIAFVAGVNEMIILDTYSQIMQHQLPLAETLSMALGGNACDQANAIFREAGFDSECLEDRTAGSMGEEYDLEADEHRLLLTTMTNDFASVPHDVELDEIHAALGVEELGTMPVTASPSPLSLFPSLSTKATIPNLNSLRAISTQNLDYSSSLKVGCQTRLGIFVNWTLLH